MFSLSAIFLFAVIAPSPAAANEPWWHLTSGSRPSYLKPGPVGASQVDRLTVPGVGFGVILLKGLNEQVTPAEKAEVFTWDATAGELRGGLEKIYGKGNVEVTGGPKATGTGELQAGSDEVKEVATTTGAFEEGKEISGVGIPKGTTIDEIKKVGLETRLTLSEHATEAQSGVSLAVLAPYTITFEEGFASQPVALEVLFGEATLTTLTEGKRSGQQIVVTAANLGDAPADGETGSPVKIVDTLPAGVKAESVEGRAGESGELGTPGNSGAVSCSLEGVAPQRAVCTFEGKLPAYSHLEVLIGVAVQGSASESGEVNGVSVSGGGAPAAGLSRALHISEAPTPFGVEDYEQSLEEPGGALDTQAGSHPFQFTTTLTLNQDASGLPVALAKDLSFRLPPGLIGNPTPFARCTLPQFEALVCPARSVVGVALITINEQARFPAGDHIGTLTVPVYNMEPSKGEPARFAFRPVASVFIDTRVRTGSDYAVEATVSNITQIAGFVHNEVIFWGVPGKPEHDSSRGPDCLQESEGAFHEHPCNPLEENEPPPLFSLPTSCESPLTSYVSGDSWLHPVAAPLAQYTIPYRPDGCDRLPFTPSIRVTPDGTAASTPTGLGVDVHVDQSAILNPDGLAQSAVKEIRVALPPGVAVNPAGGDGLQACSESQIGLEEGRGTQGEFLFSPGLPEPFCPEASKIGTVDISSPLLPPQQHLKGFIYLATQNQNPFGSLVALYIVAEDPVSGVLVKLPGETQLTPSGQLIGVFKNTPQLAFEDAEIRFFGGERAPLATPARCGTYTTTATITPWSGTEPQTAQSHFEITSGPHGGPCPGASLPFSPSLTGGTTNINAGSFSPLTTTIGREDGQQNMAQVTLHFPPGLSGLLSNVMLCPEQLANEGKCPVSSEIGETTVAAGVGSDPVSVKGGKVYITEKYHGAPFGLSIVNPVKAGPFDLEHDTSNPAQDPACDCVVVRAKIEVNPITAALTITTNGENEGYSIPHLIDGIPVQIQKVNVTVNREHFTFNPTACNPASITGEINSDESASSPVSVPFQATNCAVLHFNPKFAVSTSGKTSKEHGASLTATVSEPAGALGTQANISRVKVELPKALPSRLTTLQKACTDVQFTLNPANCPTASKIGFAKVITPLLPVPLEGPAIFVSHGGEAFPSLTMVLQGYGLTIDLVGTTFISKSGVTSTTFKTVPDTPFNTFQLTLPEGQFSALAANGNLCSQQSSLKMPTEFVGQNGMEYKQDTQLTVTGCKPEITVKSHKVKGKTATIVVNVPSAGKLVAAAKGLSKGSGKAGKAGTVTVKLHLTAAEQSRLAKHRGRKLAARVKLTFTPKKGGKLKTSVTVSVG